MERKKVEDVRRVSFCILRRIVLRDVKIGDSWTKKISAKTIKRPDLKMESKGEEKERAVVIKPL